MFRSSLLDSKAFLFLFKFPSSAWHRARIEPADGGLDPAHDHSPERGVPSCGVADRQAGPRPADPGRCRAAPAAVAGALDKRPPVL
mmetsp:Transcript_30050/g.81460  ORF Transcript_30050/g.81460 Transcript_30050/m.81460 type:complete len:86 (+) Transcript_30050:178-435(+)